MCIRVVLVTAWILASCHPSATVRHRVKHDDVLPVVPSATVGPGRDSPRLLTLAHQRELRGVWVASVANINWPSSRTLSASEQRQELARILDTSAQLGLNAVFLQVRPEGDALYPSQLEPWSYWISGVQGQAPDPVYDPLEFAVSEAHKRGLELHAWINPFRARSKTSYTVSAKHISKKLPQYARKYGGLVVMDPGAEEVRKHTIAVLQDLAARYDIDGIHMDDYFYPYPQAGETFSDQDLFSAYKAAGGGLDKGDWRRENVNDFVKRAGEMLRQIKPNLSYGVSPFGIYRPGEPPGTESALDQYGAIYADPKKWFQEGWVDYLIPQLYWSTKNAEFGFVKLLDWWLGINTRKLPLFAGCDLSKLGKSGWDVLEYTAEIRAIRERVSQAALGHVFYNVGNLLTDKDGVISAFRTDLYANQALPPVHERHPQAKGFPGEVSADVERLHWSLPTAGGFRGVTLYRKVNGAWVLQHRSGLNQGGFAVSSGEWAVAAVDLWAGESHGVVVSVK